MVTIKCINLCKIYFRGKIPNGAFFYHAYTHATTTIDPSCVFFMCSRYIHNVLEMYESESESSASDGGGSSCGGGGGGGSRAPVAEDDTRDTKLFVSV